jgi:hypothetical protein
VDRKCSLGEHYVRVIDGNNYLQVVYADDLKGGVDNQYELVIKRRAVDDKNSEIEDSYYGEDFAMDFSLKLVFSENASKDVKSKSTLFPSHI